MKNLDEAALDYVETFVKNDLTAILEEKRKNANEETTNNEMFFGKTYSSSPESFKFSLGEKYQLKEIAAFVTKIIGSEGIAYFGDMKKKKYGIQGLPTIDTHFGRLFVDDEAEEIICESINELKTKLLTDIIAIFEALNVDKTKINEFSADMIDVQEKYGSVNAIIKCILCETDNHNKTKKAKTEQKVSTKRNGDKLYWITSNFKKHLKTSHNKSIELNTKSIRKCKKPPKKTKIKEISKHDQETSANNERDIVIDGKSDLEVIIENEACGYDEANNEQNSGIDDITELDMNSVNESYHEATSPNNEQYSEIDDTYDVDMIIEYDSSYDLPDRTVPDINSEELGSSYQFYADTVEKTDESLQETIYKQISAHILLTVENSDNNDETRKPMSFTCGKKGSCLQVAAIKKNGNCMYSSVVHQLHFSDLRTKQHLNLSIQLRTEITEYISKDISKFSHDLKNRIYEEDPNTKIVNKVEQCQQFVDNVLSIDGKMGGTESLRAMYSLYEKNILIINENGDFYFIDYYNDSYGIIILAYRLSKTKDKRDHYDSVVSIEPDDIFTIAEILAKKITDKTAKMEQSLIVLS